MVVVVDFMKVQEAIEILKRFPPEYDLYVQDGLDPSDFVEAKEIRIQRISTGGGKSEKRVTVE